MTTISFGRHTCECDVANTGAVSDVRVPVSHEFPNTMSLCDRSFCDKSKLTTIAAADRVLFNVETDAVACVAGNDSQRKHFEHALNAYARDWAVSYEQAETGRVIYLRHGWKLYP